MILTTGTTKKAILKIKLLLLATILLSGCMQNIKSYRNLDVIINSDLDLRAEAVKNLIKVKLDRQKGSGTIEIFVYSYSSGAEIIEYSEKGGLKQYFSKGKISAMIKFKRSGRVREIKFTSASGRTREEIIKKLTVNINNLIKQR